MRRRSSMMGRLAVVALLAGVLLLNTCCIAQAAPDGNGQEFQLPADSDGVAAETTSEVQGRWREEAADEHQQHYCKEDGAPCSDDHQCCCRNCNYGTCEPQECREPGDTCRTVHDCCPGLLCSKEPHHVVGGHAPPSICYDPFCRTQPPVQYNPDTVNPGGPWTFSCPLPAAEGTLCTSGACAFGDPGDYTALCSRGGWLVTVVSPCQSGCWAGASLVMVKDESSGQGVPTPISTVTIGQSILCFEGGAHLGDDVREPGTPRWCKVTAWRRLREGLHEDMVRINFTKADGSLGSTTLAGSHLMHRLTKAHEGQAAAATANDLGAFVHDRADTVQPGHVLVLATSPDLNARFVPSKVTTVEFVTANGKFTPTLDAPYMWADGLMMPVWD